MVIDTRTVWPKLMRCPFVRGTLQQFQEKCETVFRPELRQNKEIEWFVVSVKRRTALATRGIKIKFTQSEPAACPPDGGKKPALEINHAP
ncbi:hypothetical protein EN753_20030 [Mesorhizobium sp. M2A.F.Ca.ET.029.05.1.1]|nr:hypothetical protein EN753_20030 [Mesorhizobium sp. M2A.F.Ca.ET.029.05.1.1]